MRSFAGTLKNRYNSLLCVGFFGEGNLGDEAILNGFLNTISKIVNHSAIVVTAGQNLPQFGYSVPFMIRRIPRKGLSAWLPFVCELQKSDRIAFLGGILQDWSVDGLVFYAMRMLAAAVVGRRPALWGAGLGPLRSSAAKAIAARVLKYANPVWFRDYASSALYKSLTGISANIGCDWSWGIPDTTSETLLSNKNSLNFIHYNSNVIGINLRPWYDNRFLQATRRALSFQSSSEVLGIAARGEDQKHLAQNFPELQIVTPASFNELLHLVKKFVGMWAMRFHVVLACLRAGVPVIPLQYDDKVTAICREAGLQDIDLNNPRFVLADPEFQKRSNERLALMQKALQDWLLI